MTEQISQHFVHLRVHSEYSLTNSIIKVKKLVAQCAELSQPAVALTDQCNFFALVKFYKAAFWLTSLVSKILIGQNQQS